MVVVDVKVEESFLTVINYWFQKFSFLFIISSIKKLNTFMGGYYFPKIESMSYGRSSKENASEWSRKT